MPLIRKKGKAINVEVLHKKIITKAVGDLKEIAKLTKQRQKTTHKFKGPGIKRVKRGQTKGTKYRNTGDLVNNLSYRVDKKRGTVKFSSMPYGEYIINGKAWNHKSDSGSWVTGYKGDDYLRNAWNYSARKVLK